jgi:hypothetical protein
MKAKKGRFGPGGLGPTVEILSAVVTNSGSPLVSTALDLAGSAHDDLLGDVSASIAWSSDLDGVLGSGATLSTTLTTAGSHVITATITDGTNSASVSTPVTWVV